MKDEKEKWCVFSNEKRAVEKNIVAIVAVDIFNANRAQKGDDERNLWGR